eukprot:5369250-Pleurochrysis_carterae.AAC.1
MRPFVLLATVRLHSWPQFVNIRDFRFDKLVSTRAACSGLARAAALSRTVPSLPCASKGPALGEKLARGASLTSPLSVCAGSHTLPNPRFR